MLFVPYSITGRYKLHTLFASHRDKLHTPTLFVPLITYLFSVNTFTPIERCAIIFVIAQVEKILIGEKIQKLQNRARCNSSLIDQ